MSSRHAADRHAPPDQAHGLRRLFAQARLRLVPVVANPHLAFPGLILERLCAALAAQGARTLLVDASDSAPPADELATMGLAQCIERLTPETSYLAARGLPLRYVDSRGSMAGLLQALADAAPQAEVVLVHASASDLARLFARQTLVADVVPLLLADDRPASVTHAYAGMKWLALRAGLGVHHLVLEAAAGSPRAAHIATQLARCADTFLGAVLRDCTLVDAAAQAQELPSDALCSLARTLLAEPRAGERAGCGAGAAALARFAPRRATPSSFQALN